MLLAKFWLNMPEIEEDSDEELEILPIVSAGKVIAAIQKFRLYEEQQMEGNPAFIREMERHEHVVWRRKLDSQSQRDIRSYFSFSRHFVIYIFP